MIVNVIFRGKTSSVEVAAGDSLRDVVQRVTQEEVSVVVSGRVFSGVLLESKAADLGLEAESAVQMIPTAPTAVAAAASAAFSATPSAAAADSSAPPHTGFGAQITPPPYDPTALQRTVTYAQYNAQYGGQQAATA